MDTRQKSPFLAQLQQRDLSQPGRMISREMIDRLLTAPDERPRILNSPARRGLVPKVLPSTR
ncbi:hypothetical protein ABLE91_16930 [Aquabacter sp. CN5-332]|uniref:hypothetical protein n=1 Tax=Aquabacter sp. CN5-332 TaxID=3156608 RepID=UPI0032B3FBAC